MAETNSDSFKTRFVPPDHMFSHMRGFYTAIQLSDDQERLAMFIGLAYDFPELREMIEKGTLSEDDATVMMRGIALDAADAALDVLKDGIPTTLGIKNPWEEEDYDPGT